MKRLLVLIILQTIYMCFAIAQSHLNVVLRFNPSDFWLNENKTIIQTESHTFVYLSDTQKPAIPYIPIQVLIPDSQKYDGFTYAKTKDSFADNVILAPNPIEKPTNSESIVHTKREKYAGTQYPEENIIYTGKNCYGNYSVLNFLVAPWIYNTDQKKIEILTSVDLRIELQTVKDDSSIYKHNSPLLPYLNVVNREMEALVKEEMSSKEYQNIDHGVGSSDHHLKRQHPGSDT